MCSKYEKDNVYLGIISDYKKYFCIEVTTQHP